MAGAMGAALLTDSAYRQLQQFGPFDRKTSSWLQTPDSIRRPGGALFGGRRHGQVFMYHNGAGSYDAARGFRALLRLWRYTISSSIRCLPSSSMISNSRAVTAGLNR